MFGRPAPAIVIVSFFLTCLPLTAPAECIWGNCQKGRGTWRHPDGAMETGIWQDGKLVVSKGRAEPVVPPKRREATSSANGRASQRDPSQGCLRGNCVAGQGVRTYRGGSNYEGTFVNGVRQGKGEQAWPDGRRYEGHWAADRRHGHGTMTYRDGRYVGAWHKGSPTRHGVRRYSNGDRYVGDYKRERRDGNGTLTFANGNRYVGEFRRDQPHGKGALYERGGGVRQGYWSRGQYFGPQGGSVSPGLVAGGTGCVAGNCWDGTGRYVYEDGREYLGSFKDGHPHGRGSITHLDGRVDSGRWQEGKRTGRRVIATPGAVASWRAKSKAGCLSGDCRNGTGRYRWKDGSAYSGEFRDARPHGYGTWQHTDGSRYVGRWRMGNRDGQGLETSARGVVRSGLWEAGYFRPARSAVRRLARRKPRIRWPDLSRAAPRSGGGESDAAVVVGIGRYAHVASIVGAADNATGWYEYFVRTRGVPVQHVSLLLDNDATREDIQWAIDEAARQVGDDGTLWFVFVGHGAPSRDGEDGLLIGFDAQQKARSIQARSIRRSDVLARLEKSKAENIRVLLDACFSGRAGDGEQLVAGLQPLVVSLGRETGDPRTTLFTAARNDEYAGPLPGADRPAFSYLALGGLRGWADANRNGRVTAGELHEYVSTALKALVRDRRQRSTFSGSPDAPLSRRAHEKGPELSSVVRELAKSSGVPASR